MIVTDRTITVRKGVSSIDDPVIVYRGDYEVAIRFTIMNSKFKFMSGVNMIESEKASYGQLAILTPYGGNVFSDMVRCSEGAVAFVMSKELMDQIEEVGLYSFQIRLFDGNRESRVSIPPVEFGIEVREPVVSEDHDNEVNNAIVGYSIAKVVDPSKEDVGATFDDNGNYNKTEWETGDRISEGKLNKIEDAIDKINQNEKTDVAALDKRINNNFNVLTSTKADITYIDNKIGSVASGSPKGVYSSLSELQSRIPNGDSNIYVTSDNGHWNYWNGSAWVSGGVYQGYSLNKKTVGMDHLIGEIGTYNLYNLSCLELGYIDLNQQTINTRVSTANYAKIKIKQNTTYVIGRNSAGSSHMSTGDPYVFLDSNGEQIGFGLLGTHYYANDIDGKRYCKITTIDNAAYICINAKINSFDITSIPNGIYVIEIDSLIDGFDNCLENSNRIYEIFSRKIRDLELEQKLDNFKQSIISSSNDICADNMVITYDMFVDVEGRIRSANEWSMGTIPVNPDTTYSIYFGSEIYTSGRGYLVFQTDTASIISYCTWGDMHSYTTAKSRIYKTFTTPSNCRFISFTLKNEVRAYNDEDSVRVVPGLMNDDDIEGLVVSIDGKKVLSPSNLNEYIKEYNIPTVSTSWDNNLLVCSVARKLANTLYNNKGVRQFAIGWTAYDLRVEPDTTYYFHSMRENYSPGNRGYIALLDDSFNIIELLEDQGSDIYETEDGTRWQIIQTTSDTSYIGMTVGAADNRFDETKTGVVIQETPTSEYLECYIKAINGIPLTSNKLDNYSHPLYNKRWVVVGDSLTEKNARSTKFYHDYIAEETGVIVYNMGKSGTGYMKRQNEGVAFYQRILNIPTNTDIVTIFGSGNDLSHPLGTPSDTGTDTICGCMHQTIQNLFSVLPGARVGIVLPCPWGSYPPSADGNKMALYCEALKEIAGQYSIPVLDLYHGSNLRPWDKTFKELYYKHDDGGSVHPDEDGHKILANKFKMFIQSL